MGSELWKSMKVAVATLVVCIIIYPLAILAAAAVIAPNERLGSLITNEQGQVIGSRLIAQGFLRPEYLWPRPSAVAYNASAAGGSNLSPANPAIRERAEKILALLDVADGLSVPADLVTASGAGLDPHISLQSALLQTSRVAIARNMSEETVANIFRDSAVAVPLTTDEEKLVNVLEANLALDVSAAP